MAVCILDLIAQYTGIKLNFSSSHSSFITKNSTLSIAKCYCTQWREGYFIAAPFTFSKGKSLPCFQAFYKTKNIKPEMDRNEKSPTATRKVNQSDSVTHKLSNQVWVNFSLSFALSIHSNKSLIPSKLKTQSLTLFPRMKVNWFCPNTLYSWFFQIMPHI